MGVTFLHKYVFYQLVDISYNHYFILIFVLFTILCHPRYVLDSCEGVRSILFRSILRVAMSKEKVQSAPS